MGLVYTNPVQLKIKFSSIRQGHESKILIAKSFKDIHSIPLISDKRRIHAKYKLISNHNIYFINNANYINAIYTFRYITFVSLWKRNMVSSLFFITVTAFIRHLSATLES